MGLFVTLTTDFGGHYVGIMKGVIKRIAPVVEVIEISSDIPPFDVKSGAFVLYSSYRFFPSRTVHVAVIDPGVGSERRAVAIKSRNFFFVGPDNGVLVPAAKDDGIVEVREVTNRRLFLEEVSSTFHGRDIFVPVAAFLAKGGRFEEVGGRVEEFKGMDFFKMRKDGGIECEVVFVDRFGNLVTSLRGEDVKLEGEVVAEVEGKAYRMRYVGTYSDGERGELLILRGSSGHYEVSLREGSARDLTGMNVGSRMLFVNGVEPLL
ncbi:MAG: SAM hydrolase/SAM-dependent halogenase family protein [Candidatus Methanomethylicaceae archaeon]